MKNIILKKLFSTFVLVYILLIDFKAFAFQSDPGDDTDDLEGGLFDDDTMGASSPKLIYILIVGLLFVFYYFKNQQIKISKKSE